MFDSYPKYDRYRTLMLVPDSLQRGEDVYALQTALATVGADPLGLDGIFGSNTFDAVKKAQVILGVTADGKAGSQTQIALCKRISYRSQEKYSLPSRLVFGQVSHESSCRVGNYSPARPNGSYDAGAAQRNTEFTPAEEGFKVPESIDTLASNTRLFFQKFQGIQDTRRRWELASGAWNAPAYACWIANEEGASVPRSQTAQPSPTARQRLEAYMTSATAYMVL